MQTSNRALVGIFLAAIGLFLLLDNLRIIPYELYFLRSWQMLLIVIGVFNFLTGRKNAAFVLIAIGGFFLIDDFFRIDFRDFWPVILIIVGVAFFLSRRSGKESGAEDVNFFDDINIFGGGDKQYVSPNLEGGKVTNIFGGSNIDLRQSHPVPDAVIEVFTLFGGCEIIVPEDWRVKIEATSIFGAFNDERNITNQSEENPRVIIKGFTMFGGGELKN